MKEFDAEYFARTMRKVDMILASTMDDSEHFLANYQQINAIKLDQDSNTDSEEVVDSRRLRSGLSCLVVAGLLVVQDVNQGTAHLVYANLGLGFNHVGDA